MMFEKLTETIRRMGYCSGLGRGYLFLGGMMLKPGELEQDNASGEEA